MGSAPAPGDRRLSPAAQPATVSDHFSIAEVEIRNWAGISDQREHGASGRTDLGIKTKFGARSDRPGEHSSDRVTDTFSG